MLPAASVERTWKVWLPAARPLYFFGELQLWKVSSSSLHSKLPGSVEPKAKLASVEPVLAGGAEVIAVFGAVESST